MEVGEAMGFSAAEGPMANVRIVRMAAASDGDGCRRQKPVADKL